MTQEPKPKTKPSKRNTTGSPVVDALLVPVPKKPGAARHDAAKLLASAMESFQAKLRERGIDRSDLLD